LFGVSHDTAAASLLTLLGISAKDGAVGLFQLIKWLGGKTIKKITKLGDGKVKIEVDEGSVEAEEMVVELMRNIKIRQSLEVIVTKPLSRDGVDTFNIKQDEANYFIAPQLTDEQLEDQVAESNLQLLNISFQDGNKWKFTDGNATFYAMVKDEDFIAKVQDNRNSFAKDDILKVRLRKKQWVAEEGIKSEYIVEEIISHRPALRQIPLNFDEAEDEQS
jgi:hypothetical protein